MNRVIRFSLDSAGIQGAIRELRDYQQRLRTKCAELSERLAQYGLQRAQMEYDAAIYDGTKDVTVNVEERGENTYAIVASGRTVLILEFGAGIYGDGHPLAGEMGYGPGTYPGQTHVPDPGYWWFTDENGKSVYSYGNPPSMAMYMTSVELMSEIERIAREVFST